MSLVQAAKDSLKTLMADQYREFFYCTSLSNNMLMVKGQKQKGFNNNNGLDNIITNGSVVSVNAGQCMLIVDQGRIVEFCAEPGEFTYDASSEPSFLYGELTGERIKKTVKDTVSQFVRRTSFAGTGKDQRVYYINTKEVQGNLYGTSTPIPFHFVAKSTGFEIETTIKCNGTFSFKIVDPILFYTNVAGNVEDSFPKSEEFLRTMKAELLTKLPKALGQIAANGVLPSELPYHLDEVAEYLKEELTPDWTDKRGIEVVSMTMSAPIVPQEDLDKINNWYSTAVLTNANMQSAKLTESFAQMMGQMGQPANNYIIPGAAGEGGEGGANKGIVIPGNGGGANSTDAVMNMMGLGMMKSMMDNGMNGMFNMFQPQQSQMKPASTVAEGAVLGWDCSCGKTDNRGRFCQECGLPKPALDGWTCACGNVNQGKFCQDCGRKKPDGAPLYKCDKCGWEPEDPTNPPKFCPECGDPFDDNDRINQ